jgi:putative transposase
MDKFDTNRSLTCRTIELDRKTSYGTSIKDDSELEAKLREYAQKYPTRGIDWYYLKSRLEGHKWNRKKVLRVYRKLGLVQRRKFKRRLPQNTGLSLAQPIIPNYCWSMDFMSDSLEDGRTVRVLNIIDDYNRECLTIRCGISFPSLRVIRILTELIELKGRPENIRTDNGPEFISHAYKDWCEQNGINDVQIDPGKPNQNGYVERFNRTFREDILDAFIFTSIPQLQIVVDRWVEQYNSGHPHQALLGMTPVGFKYSRHKIIDAYENVKAKLNASNRGGLDIISTNNRLSLSEYSME